MKKFYIIRKGKQTIFSFRKTAFNKQHSPIMVLLLLFWTLLISASSGNAGIPINNDPGASSLTTTDTDMDGVVDDFDMDDDNDGILDINECISSNFYWSNPPTISGNTATGTINGIGYTYTSSVNVTSTSYVFNHGIFPTEYNIPNDNPTIQNVYPSSNTLTFDSPMTNPVLVFASIGGGPISVPINFSAPVEVLWSTATVQNSPTQITGTEGYAVVRMNGTFTSISFDYLTYENWVNFLFGADFYTYCDTDNDGIVDRLDPDSDNDGCFDAYEGSMGLTPTQAPNGIVSGGVDQNGVPTLVGSQGQEAGTSTIYSETCVCDLGLDTTNPVAVAQDITIQLDVNNYASIEVSDINNGSSDNCEILSVNLSKTEFTCANIGDNNVTLTVTDVSGNITQTTAVVSVLPAPLPEANDDEFAAEACQPFTFTNADLLANDTDPAGQTLKVDFVGQPSSGTLTDNGDGTYTYTPSDNTNHTVTLSYIVKRNDGTTVFAENGHYYEFVNAPGITWTDAKIAAEAKTYQGKQGYLATITSAAENGFAAAKLQGSGWIGGSDSQQEGVWKWVTGPEAGTHFSNQLKTGWCSAYTASGINGNYANWYSGEPNDCGNSEDYAHFYSSGVWNDYPNNAGGNIAGYVVEYGGIDDDCDIDVTAEATITINLTDDVAPVVLTQNISVELDSSGQATITSADIDNGSSDNCGIESLNLDIDSFGCNNIGANTVTLTVVDVNGNSASGTAQVTVSDTVAPTAVCQNISIILDDTGNASILADPTTNNIFSETFANDANGVYTNTNITNWSVSGDIDVGDWNAGIAGRKIDLAGFGNGTITSLNSYTLTPGNYSFGFQHISNTYNDNSVRVVIGSLVDQTFLSSTSTIQTELINFTVTNIETVQIQMIQLGSSNAGGSFIGQISLDEHVAGSLAIEHGSSDNCGIASITASKTTFDCTNIGDNNVVLTVTDHSGNSSTCNAIVTVEDNIPPVITCPANIEVNNDPGQCGAIVDFSATATDNCDVTITYSHQPGSSFPTGSTSVTATATDLSGNTVTCVFEVTVVDTELPNISCPFDITVNVDPGECGAVVEYDIPSATDNCGSGDVPTSLANHTFRGLYNGHSYFLSNSMTTPEVAHANAIASGGHLATISDINENQFISGFNPGKIWIGMTDRDSEGNWGWITSEPVTYTNWAPGEPNNAGGSEDWAVINWSGNNPNWNDWYFTATAYYAIEFDGGTIPTQLVSGLPSGSVFPVGTTEVTYAVVDPSGNTVQCSFNVTVVDNQPPTVVTKDITLELDASGHASITPADIDNGSNDCGNISMMSLDLESFDCANLGENTVTLTVSDANGNSSSSTAIVTVVDNVAPVVLTQNATVQLDANGQASITAGDIDNGSNDACGIASLELDKVDFDCSNVGENTVTLTATDVSGNVSTATATVTVEDMVAPVALTQNVTIQLDGNGMASVTADEVDNGSNDVCGIASLELDKYDFNCSNVGSNTVVLTVTDANGNVATETAIVTVEDDIVPVLTAPAAITQLNDPGVCGAIVEIGSATASDNCGIASIENDGPEFYPEGTTMVTWTATDVNGNIATATQEVTIYNEDPVINTIDVTNPILIDEGAVAGATFTDNNLVSATWYWGDGSSSSGVIDGSSVTGDHFYSLVGPFEVSLVVEDACGATAELSYGTTIVVDPCAGHVTGGGWIEIQNGDYQWDAGISGKANAGYVAKYDGNVIDDESQMTFHIKDAQFTFESTEIYWLVIDSDQAVFSGEGTINDTGQYYFLASVIDGDVVQKHAPDNFRIVIWDETGAVIFDNQANAGDFARAAQEISNGSIKIHKGCNEQEDNLADEPDDNTDSGNDSKNKKGNNGKGKLTAESNRTLPTISSNAEESSKSSSFTLGSGSEFNVQLYPNPVKDRINLNLDALTNGEITVEIFDITGRIFFRNEKIEVWGNKTSFDVSHTQMAKGNYLIRIIDNTSKASSRIQFNKE